jgi:hypothetical protein
MNTFNRIFTIVGLVILILAGALALLAPAAFLALLGNLANAIHAGPLGGMSDVGRFLVRLLIAVVYVGALGSLVWLQFRGFGGRTVEVQRSTGGRIRLTTRDLEQRIQQQVNAISGVVSSRVRVSERDNAVVAQLEVEAMPELDPVAKGEEVAVNTRLVVQDQLGVKLAGKPQVTVRSARLTRPKEKPASPVRRYPAPAADAAPLPVIEDSPAANQAAAPDAPGDAGSPDHTRAAANTDTPDKA